MFSKNFQRVLISTRTFASSVKSGTGKESSTSKKPSKTSSPQSSPPKAAASPPKQQGPPISVVNKAAGNEYLVPEYFQHDINTYADLFVDMSRHRLPPPIRPGRH